MKHAIGREENNATGERGGARLTDELPRAGCVRLSFSGKRAMALTGIQIHTPSRPPLNWPNLKGPLLSAPSALLLLLSGDSEPSRFAERNRE